MSDKLSAEKIRELNDIDDEAKTGKITHDDARAMLSRFINSHFNNPGEKARASIPVDFTRDDDVRMAAYIVQMRKRDAAIADALDKCERLENALEKIMNNPHGCDFLGVAEIARAALTQPEGDKR